MNPVCIIIILIILGIIGWVLYRLTKSYSTVKIILEQVSIHRGLSPVEVACLLDKPDRKIAGIAFIELLESGVINLDKGGEFTYFVTPHYALREHSLAERKQIRMENAQREGIVLSEEAEKLIELLAAGEGIDLRKVDLSRIIAIYRSVTINRLMGYSIGKTRGYYQDLLKAISDDGSKDMEKSTSSSRSTLTWQLINDNSLRTVKENPEWYSETRSIPFHSWLTGLFTDNSSPH
ncbi:MAG: hypothetical protein JXA19_06370 [Anaerolineales bacterium]|nr:hypothetical protein [Anaerolineales bacterium]